MAKGLIAIFGITSLFRSPWKPQVLVQGGAGMPPTQKSLLQVGVPPLCRSFAS